jgi:hypothetical protein
MFPEYSKDIPATNDQRAPVASETRVQTFRVPYTPNW